MPRVVEYAPHPETGEWWPVASIGDRVRIGQWPGPKLDDGHAASLRAGMRTLLDALPSLYARVALAAEEDPSPGMRDTAKDVITEVKDAWGGLPTEGSR